MIYDESMMILLMLMLMIQFGDKDDMGIWGCKNCLSGREGGARWEGSNLVSSLDPECSSRQTGAGAGA